MFTAGIDLGTKTTYAVILNDGRVVAQRCVLTGWEPPQAAEHALTAALADARLSRDDLARIVATGAGRRACPLAAHNITEVTADARALAHLFPRLCSALDVGAEEARAFNFTATGRVLDFAVNDKCAAGSGIFIETMARALEATLDELDALALQATGAVMLNSPCAVFAESEVISLIHAQTPRAEIARAVFASIAARVAALARRIGSAAEIALGGGLARSPAFVAALARELAVKVSVPRDPEFVGALGAALIARDSQ